MKIRALAAIGVFLSAASLLFTMWIVLPAPATSIWLVSVVASEWSLHFGLLAVLGLTLSALGYRNKNSKPRLFGITAGTIALVCALVPIAVSLPMAQKNELNLSLSRYLFGHTIAPPSVETYEYALVDSQRLSLDVYTPAHGRSDQVRPAVVVVHGGSWRSGARSDFPEWNAWLVEQGFAVFDIEYRLSPQPNWQTATEDVQNAVRWVKSSADSFGIDSSRVVLFGRSAGGHLALLAAYTAPTTVQAVVAFYPPTDLAWSYEHPANQRVTDGPATLRQFTGGTPAEIPSIYSQASPIRHVTSTTPPTLLLHGGKDQLVLGQNSSRLLHALETASGKTHQALVIPYAQHGFDYNFNGWGSQMTQELLSRFLNEHLVNDGSHD